MRLRVERNEDGKRSLVLKREVVPLEGTNMSLFHTIIPSWWAENGLSSTASWMPGNAQLAERVWVANRCIKLNAQQISDIPLRWSGPPSVTPPHWLTSPDPNMFPNGIKDALHCVVSQIYGWGFSCQYVTDYYADGFPRTWTVLDSAALTIKIENGQREYKYGDTILNPRRVVQIDRDPSLRAHGTPALSAYAQQCWGLLAAGNQSMTVMQGGIPTAVLKSSRKIDSTQAQALQEQWMEATQRRNGAPPVLPPELDFETLSFNPSDLSLLETQRWNAVTIMNAFGVPSMLLNVVLEGGLAYQNPAQLAESWIWFELAPMADRIADAFTAQMLPSGQSVSFDVQSMFIPVGPNTSNEPQASQVAKASPAQQGSRLTAIGGAG